MSNINRLNDVVEYIERNLTQKIDYTELARIALVDQFSLGKIFCFMSGISIGEYIRKRRLSQAAAALQAGTARIIDIAGLYGYDSPEAFTRAFKKMYGVNPSKIKPSTFLKTFGAIKFDNSFSTNELNMRIDLKPSLTLYGKYITIPIGEISKKAPEFWENFKKTSTFEKMKDKQLYGVIQFDSAFPISITANYYIASALNIKGLDKIEIPNNKYAIFKIDSKDGAKINTYVQRVYSTYIPYSGYNIQNSPELEVYNQEGIEWWLPIISKTNT